MKSEKQILVKIRYSQRMKNEYESLRDYYRYKNGDKSNLYYDLYMAEYYKIKMLKWVLK